MNPYLLGPIFGALFGALFGWLMNNRAILGTANWIPGCVVMGVLWGFAGAARIGSVKKEDREKGEFLTETKAYKKKITKQEEQKAKDEQK